MHDGVTGVLERYIKPGDRVGVGLSGGADSVFLARALNEYCESRGCFLIALHLEHGMRGAESERDMEFVKSFCAELHMECAVMRVPAGKLRSEEDARRARYAFFERCAQKYRLAHIALAHHADDRAETVLFNLTRGCGLSGLHPMPERSGIYLRPLLSVSRADIEYYLAEEGVGYVTDSTNSDEELCRNRIRKNVIPQLKRINPSFLSSVERLCAIAEEDDAALYAMAEGALLDAQVGEGFASVELSAIEGLPVAVKKRALRLLVKRVSSLTDISAVNVQAMLRLTSSRPGCMTPLPHGLCAVIYGGRLTVSRSDYEQPFERRVFALDADKLPPLVERRHPQPGDFIVPLGMGGRKLLKDYLREKGVPQKLRAELFVLAGGSEVYAVEGVDLSERARIDENTRRILTVRGEGKNILSLKTWEEYNEKGL